MVWVRADNFILFLFAGLLYDMTGSYDASFLFAGGCVLSGATIQGLANYFDEQSHVHKWISP